MKKCHLSIILITLFCNQSVLAKEQTESSKEQTELNQQLHDAILINSVDELAGLVNRGAGINNEYRNKWTPLMFGAFNCSSEETIKELLLLGSDRSLKDVDGQTAYMIAKEANECPEILYLLGPAQN